MKITNIFDNPDGSAEFTFDLSDADEELMFKAGLVAIQTEAKKYAEPQWGEAKLSLVKLGIITGIINGIEHAQKNPETSSAEE